MCFSLLNISTVRGAHFRFCARDTPGRDCNGVDDRNNGDNGASTLVDVEAI